MRPDDVAESQRAHLTKIAGKVHAFVPPPLPPTLSWNAGTISALERATHAVGELRGLGLSLPNPYLFTRPFLNREAVLSSRIEGTQTSLAELYAFEAQAPLFALPERRDDAQEVRNYARALEHGRARLAELPISARLLREMHRVLMSGVRGERRAPGEFRRIQNWIGPPGATLDEATYVPPPPGDDLRICLSELERFIHAASDLPVLVRVALIHYQFEAIHPFLDGNGRIGRLLITLLLLERNLLTEPLLYLSAFFERHRTEYYDLLLRVSREGAWIPWIEFFLRGVAQESRDAAVRARSMLGLREELRDRYQRERSSANLLAAIDQLFAHPLVTITQLADALGVGFPTASNIVGTLERDDVLHEITGRRRDRIYRATKILEILQEAVEV